MTNYFGGEMEPAPGRFLVTGYGIAGDDNGFALVLTHMDCGDSFLVAYSGVAPTVEQVNGWAAEHRCGLAPWRRIGADDLAAL